MTSFREFIGSTSYREAQAWVFVVVNMIVMIVYGQEVFAGNGLIDGESLPAIAGLIIVGVCTTFFTILLIVPTAIIFNRTANEAADERDKRLHTEGAALAFWMVFVLASLSLIAYVFHASGDILFHSVLMTILLAQFVYAFATGVKYRRSGAPMFQKAQS
ncbi:MAG: hypothetical protein ABJO36_09135 [Litorimonas sp.]